MAIGPNNAGAENVDGTSQNIVMMQLQLQASAVEDIQINSLSLTTGGSGFRNDEVVSPDIRIYRDMNNNGVFDTGIDELIITQNYVGNAWNFPGNTTINLTNRYIYAGATENWLIVNNFVNGDLGDNLELSLVNNSDISATGVTSSQSVNVNGATLNGGAKTVVNGTTPGTLSMALGPNDPGFQNILPGATNKSMINSPLSASSEDINISEVTFVSSRTNDKGDRSGFCPIGPGSGKVTVIIILLIMISQE